MRRTGATIGDILAAKLPTRMELMVQEDEWAAQVAAQLKDEFDRLGQRLGLTVLHFGIKKPSRTGMIKVTIRSGRGTNLHPRSPAFRKFVQIVQPHGLWLAWVTVKQQDKEADNESARGSVRQSNQKSHRDRPSR